MTSCAPLPRQLTMAPPEEASRICRPSIVYNQTPSPRSILGYERFRNSGKILVSFAGTPACTGEPPLTHHFDTAAQHGAQHGTQTLLAIGDMDLHDALGAIGVTAGDRLDQRQVFVADPAVPGVGFGQERHGVVQTHANFLDGSQQIAVAGGASQREMKSGVVLHIVRLTAGASQ